MIPAQGEENESIEPTRLDRSFAVFAILVFLWGCSEYLFPPTEAFFERSIPKLIHASILFWSGASILYDIHTAAHSIRFRNLMVFGFVLSAILMFFPMFTYNRAHHDLIRFLQAKFYAGCFITQWFVVFLYCSIHLQVNPKAYHTFLKFVPFIVVAFFFAVRKHTNLNIAVRSEEFQSGIYSGYYLAALFPFAWDVRNKIVRVFLIILIIYGTIYSMKRGAMLCLASSLFLSFFTYYIFFANGIKRIPYFFGMAVVLGILILSAIYSISQKEATFQHRMDNIGSGSGRLVLYKSSWEIFKSLPPEEKIFGARSEENQIRSHNDFLFTLVNFGIIGFSVFFVFNTGYIFLLFQAFSDRLPNIPSLTVALGNMLIIEMVSYGLEGHAFMICCIYAGMVQGYLLADTNEEIEIIEFDDDDFEMEEEEEEEDDETHFEEDQDSSVFPRIFNGEMP